MKPITIDVEPSGNFILHIPGDGDGHHVRIPTTEAGLTALQRLLVARKEPGLLEGIGTEPAPIQHMVDEWLKDHQITRSVNGPPTVGIDLSKYDL